MTPFNFIFYFNICNVTVCNIHTFPSWKMYNLVFHRKVFKSRVLSETNWSSLGGEILSPLRWMQVVSQYLTCLPLCLFSLVFWLMLLTVRQIQRGVLWLGLWSSVERLSVWKNTHMNILCRWQWVCLRRVNCWKKKSKNIEIAFALCYFVLVQTVIHELFHVLGFSQELFSRWKDCSLSAQGR